MTVLTHPASTRPRPGADTAMGKVRMVLEAFTADDVDLSLADLARRTGLPKATVHRLCQELAAWGALERVAVRYRLGLRLWELGQRVPRQRVFREAALPYLENLLLVTRETVHAAVLDGREAVYIERLSGRASASSAPSRMGGRMDLHATATGKCLLAHSSSDFVEQVLASELPAHTPHTVVAPELLRRQLAHVRRNGFAVERSEVRVGYLSVAAPVFGVGGVVVGAISVTAPTARATAAALAPTVRAAAAGVSRSLGGAPRAAGVVARSVAAAG